MMRWTPTFLVAALAAAAAPVWGQAQRPWRQTDPRYGLLTPIPQRGAVPPIVELAEGLSRQQIAFNARQREHARRIRRIRHEFLGEIRVPDLRAEGIARLARFTDPAAFEPLVQELAGEDDDVRLAVLDHLAGQAEQGQAALAWVAIHDGDEAIRHEALRRLVAPPGAPVLRVLDAALRSNRHEVANNAGTVAGAVHALEAIPLLIFAQATADPVEQEGDLAWIAVATQRAFVAGVEPVVGRGAAAFRPIPGVVQEGTILRVVDAVAVFYRTEIHRSLVAMTTQDWGRSTAHLDYDIRAWWQWYNDEYVPFKNRQLREARLLERQQNAGEG